MHTMTDSERAVRATTKALHAAVRAELRSAHASGGQRHRYAILAWGFVRGLPYRRFERNHNVQALADGKAFEHNLPGAMSLIQALALFLPEAAAALPKQRWDAYDTKSPTYQRIAAWLADPSGAVPAPAPRLKRVFAGRHGELQAAE